MPSRKFVLIFLLPALFFASALNFRLRLLGDELHIGGAEFAVAPYDIFLFFIAVVFMSSRAAKGMFKVSDGINSAALLFIGLSLFSIFNSEQPVFTFLEFCRHLKVFFLFLLLRRIFSKDDGAANVLCVTVVVLVVAEFLVSGLQLLSGNVDVTEDAAEVKEVFVEGGLVRVAGTLRHPNLLALYLNLVFPFLAFGALHCKNKLIYISAMVILLAILLMTYSRTQIALFFVIALAILFVMEGARAKALVRDSRVLLALTPVFLGVMLLIAVNAEDLYERFFNAPETNTSTRLILNLIAFNMIFENPFVGIGWNSFVDTMWIYDPYKMAASFQYPVHNMYLLILSETGVLGFLGYVILLIKIFSSYRFAAKNLTESFHRNFLRAGGISIFIVLITGLQGWSFRADSIQFLVWTSYAIVAAMYDVAKKERSLVVNRQRVFR